MTESGNNTSSRPSHPSKVLEGTLREGERVDTPSTKTNAPQGPEALSEGTSASISKDIILFWEFFNFGLWLPVSGFVDEVLMILDLALAKGGFGDEVQAHWSLSPSTLSTEDSAKTQTEVVATRKDPLARISKQKSVAVLESSPDVPALALVSKKSRKTTKKTVP
ncbi:hypothetical protein LIER_36128 [Lithospermum erythrorhizon]|uniref:Uncharacterized protein n=1 Tax=Lithospermum erythrorhizon TaxID=34254 RepID=A0AAV3P2K0_LITER